MIHPILQSVAKYIELTVPFRAAEFAQTMDKLSEANGQLNRSILSGEVNGFDVPSIERQMADLRKAARIRRDGGCRTFPQLGINSPHPVKASPRKTAKVIPFELGMRMLKRQLTPSA